MTAEAVHRDPLPRCLSLTCSRQQSVGVCWGVHGQVGTVVAQIAQDGLPKRRPTGFLLTPLLGGRRLPGHLQDRAVRQTDEQDTGHTPETQSVAAGSENGLKTCQGCGTRQWVMEWGSH